MDENKRAVGRLRALKGWRLALLRGCLLGGSLALLVGMLEVGLRIVGVGIPTATVMSAFFEYDADTGWRGRPNATGRFVTAIFDSSVTHDVDGWRRSALETPIDEDAQSAHRIVWCVGDSCTWGWGVSDGEGYVDELNRLSGPETRFRNLGLPGFSSVQEYLLVKQQFERGRRPDQVLVFFDPNDWHGNLAEARRDPPQPWVSREGDEFVIQGWPVPPTYGWTVRSWLRRNSLAFNFLNFHYQHARHTVRVRSHASKDRSIKLETLATEEARDALRFVYRQMQRLCLEHDVDFAVACDFADQPELRAICRELKIPLWDATDRLTRFRESPRSDEPLFFRADPHWTQLGHSLVAESIIEHMEALPRIADRERGIKRR